MDLWSSPMEQSTADSTIPPRAEDCRHPTLSNVLSDAFFDDMTDVTLPHFYDNPVNKRLPRAPGAFRCLNPGCPAKPFDTRAQMNKHRRSHIPEFLRRFRCAQCGKGFNDARDLKRHVDRKTKCFSETAHSNDQSRSNRDDAFHESAHILQHSSMLNEKICSPDPVSDQIVMEDRYFQPAPSRYASKAVQTEYILNDAAPAQPSDTVSEGTAPSSAYIILSLNKPKRSDDMIEYQCLKESIRTWNGKQGDSRHRRDHLDDLS